MTGKPTRPLPRVYRPVTGRAADSGRIVVTAGVTGWSALGGSTRYPKPFSGVHSTSVAGWGRNPLPNPLPHRRRSEWVQPPWGNGGNGLKPTHSIYTPSIPSCVGRNPLPPLPVTLQVRAVVAARAARKGLVLSLLTQDYAETHSGRRTAVGSRGTRSSAVSGHRPCAPCAPQGHRRCRAARWRLAPGPSRTRGGARPTTGVGLRMATRCRGCRFNSDREREC